MSGLFKASTPKLPKPIPLPDEATIEARRRRAQQQGQAQSGRASTQLAPRAAQTGQEFTRNTLG